MEIPINAQVECTDGICGRSEFVLINPVIKKVTHLVVKEDAAPNTEYIVPIEFVTKTIADTIQLRCNKADLKKMKPFMKKEFIEENAPRDNLGGYGMYGMGTLYYYPYIVLDTKVIESVNTQQIPSFTVVPESRHRMAMSAKSMNSLSTPRPATSPT